MKFLGQWIELENIILSKITQSKGNTHVCTYSLICGYSPKAQNKQDIIHRPHEAQEKGKTESGCFVFF